MLLCLLPGIATAQYWYSVERDLAALYLPTGKVDGEVDPKTYEAIELFLYTFGYPVKRQLQDEERTTLSRAAKASQATGPFIFEEKRPIWDTLENYFLGRTFSAFERKIYANGQHYMMMRTELPYHPENQSKHLDKFELNTKRVRAYRDNAKTLAKQAQNPLALSIYTLTVAPDEDTGMQDTLDALYSVLPVAESNPKETALTALLAEGLPRRLPNTLRCREWPEAEQLSSLLTRAVIVANQSGLPAYSWSSLVERAVNCSASEEQDGLYQLRYDQSVVISDYAQRSVLLSWARDADAGGNTERARSAYRQAMAFMVASDNLNSNKAPEESLIPTTDAVSMARLGLTEEADQLAAAHVEKILNRPPLRDGASRLELGSYASDGLLTSLMLLDLNDTDRLKKLADKATMGANSDDPTALFGPWASAQLGMRYLKANEEFGRAIQVGLGILPAVMEDSIPKAKVVFNLLIAEAAMELGDFELAETRLSSAQTIASVQGLTPLINDRVTAVQEKLVVFSLDRLPLADRVVQQVNDYYGADCKGGPDRSETSYWPFPDIAFEDFSDDPVFGKGIVQSNLLAILERCHPINQSNRGLTRFQSRLFCAVAVLNGRADHVTAILKEKDSRSGDILNSVWCVYGLADVGETQWMRRAGWALQNHNVALLFNLMTADPTARAQFLGRYAGVPLPGVKLNELPWGFLELELPTEQRRKLLSNARRSFLASHGNIGAQDEDFRAAHLAGVALGKLGLFNIAEAMYFLDDRVDPFAFGTEDPERLAAHLLDTRAIEKRLAYAKLYRAAGKFEKARAAISPLVELAVERLTSSDNPLPGTVEQWSERLSDAFELYLILQFDPSKEERNYHSLLLVQQFVQAAQSTASLSLIEQRLNSSSPETAREYQDAQHIMRTIMRDPNAAPGALEAATNRLREAEAGLSQEGTALDAHQIGVIRTLSSAVNVLEPGEATLIITQLDNVLVQTMLTDRTVQARRLNLPRHSSREQVNIFRSSIINSRPLRDRFDNRLARRLYDEMVGWAIDGPVPERLNIVADGVWATMPFAALRSGDGWLAQTTVLRASPSLSRVVASGEQQDRRANSGRSGRFMGFGDPVLANYDRRPGVSQGARLAPLPETESELFFLASVFSTNPRKNVFTGVDASEATFLRLNQEGRLGKSRVLALATHGLLSRDEAGIGEAALVLSDPQDPQSDGFLSASELYSYHIGADLVILSACNTGTPGAAGGISDLASAFFYAGANGLLLTHWEIDSAAALEIMGHFAVSFRDDSLLAEESLQFAIKEMLNDPSLEKFHHPRFWASHFILS